MTAEAFRFNAGAVQELFCNDMSLSPHFLTPDIGSTVELFKRKG